MSVIFGNIQMSYGGTNVQVDIYFSPLIADDLSFFSSVK